MNITPEVKNSLLNSYRNAVYTANKVLGVKNVPVLVDLGLNPDQDVWPLLKQMLVFAGMKDGIQSLDIRVNGLGYKPGDRPEVFVMVKIHRRKVFDSETYISVALVKRVGVGTPHPFETFFEAVVCDFTNSYSFVFVDDREKTGVSSEIILMEKLKNRVVERFHDSGITVEAKIGKERMFVEPEEEMTDACLRHTKSIGHIKYVASTVVEAAISAGLDAKITVTGKVKKDNGSIGTFRIRDRATVD